MDSSIQAAISVPSIFNRTRISDAAIQGVIDQIVAQFHPLKMILFGSYAYGIPRPESDVDLLVVMPTQLSELSQAVEICRAIQYRFGLDLIVITPQKLTQRLAWGDSFLREITTKGQIVYESPDA